MISSRVDIIIQSLFGCDKISTEINDMKQPRVYMDEFVYDVWTFMFYRMTDVCKITMPRDGIFFSLINMSNNFIAFESKIIKFIIKSCVTK